MPLPFDYQQRSMVLGSRPQPKQMHFLKSFKQQLTALPLIWAKNVADFGGLVDICIFSWSYIGSKCRENYNKKFHDEGTPLETVPKIYQFC